MMASSEATRQMAIVRLLAEGPCLTTAELVAGSGLTRNEVADACVRLIRREWVDRLERGCFVLSPRGRQAVAAGEIITSGPAGPLTQRARRPRRRTIRDKMWAAIRIAGKFSLQGLEELSGASPDNARRFVGALERAGYLAPLRREAGEAPTSNGFKRWLLVDDTGPATPVLKTDGRFWDANTHSFREVAR